MSKKTIFLFIAMCFGLSAQVSIATDLTSKYIFRGANVVDDLSIQPSLDFDAGPLAFNVWGSFGLANRDVNKFVDELNYTVTYGLDLKAVEVNIGAILYHLPNFNGEKTTTEIYGDASFSIGVLGASAALYYDIDQFKDFYANVGINYSLGIVDFNGSIGYNNAGSDISDINLILDRGFSFANVEASVYTSFVISPLYDDNVFYVGAHFGF